MSSSVNIHLYRKYDHYREKLLFFRVLSLITINSAFFYDWAIKCKTFYFCRFEAFVDSHLSHLNWTKSSSWIIIVRLLYVQNFLKKLSLASNCVQNKLPTRRNRFFLLALFVYRFRQGTGCQISKTICNVYREIIDEKKHLNFTNVIFLAPFTLWSGRHRNSIN